MIRKVDQLWQEHLLRMDHLRSDVNLRTVGQRDPLMEFKHDAFAFFDEFSRTLRTEAAQDLFRFQIVMRAPPTLQDMLAQLQLETNRSFVPEDNQAQPPAPQTDEERFTPAEEPKQEKLQPILAGPKPGRNDNCPCGSGKKYKKCCGLSSDDTE
jgi:preprotein translocase subunit SecA